MGQQEQKPTQLITTPSNKDTPTSYYYIDPSKEYIKSRPHPTQDLLALYGLERLANSVARLNDDGSKGVKLRKSYKAHISELTGKHNIQEDREYKLSYTVFAPDRESPPIEFRSFDPKALSYKIGFSRTPESGIPGFNPVDLAIGDGVSSAKRKLKVQAGVEDPKRRRVE
ncbi:hypothetical protein WICPIJ_010123 [Wickerhamomyces pijperi]|uniref:Mediator of RNA polymerase II transcription subunit 19 n=1 Tax=Wickerhamomyces pijperi TaxID=599730 RepID=A0A9P8TB01_WICPI|nr:hypothetical protein WICPIJ_010123 [Wickerhamomyces pijperi]